MFKNVWIKFQNNFNFLNMLVKFQTIHFHFSSICFAPKCFLCLDYVVTVQPPYPFLALTQNRSHSIQYRCCLPRDPTSPWLFLVPPRYPLIVVSLEHVMKCQVTAKLDLTAPDPNVDASSTCVCLWPDQTTLTNLVITDWQSVSLCSVWLVQG